MSMDAVEFVNKMNRMCAKYPDCVGCPIETENKDEDCMSKVSAEQMVDIVKKWTSEHPIKTRQSLFLEQYPEARIGDDGVLQIYPCLISASHRNARGNCATMGCECPDCRREFWMQEVE